MYFIRTQLIFHNLSGYHCQLWFSWLFWTGTRNLAIIFSAKRRLLSIFGILQKLLEIAENIFRKFLMFGKYATRVVDTRVLLYEFYIDGCIIKHFCALQCDRLPIRLQLPGHILPTSCAEHDISASSAAHLLLWNQHTAHFGSGWQNCSETLSLFQAGWV